MRICISINTSSQVQRRRPTPRPADADRRHDQQLMGLAGPVRPPRARIRFWRAASRERLRRRRTPTRHHRGTPARTAWGGHVGDPGGPGADDGVAAESVQCRPGHSPVGAVDVCTVTPQASRRGGWRRSVHKCAPPGCLGKFPQGRDPARRHARPVHQLPPDGVLDPLPTPAQIGATGVGGVDAYGDGLSLTQRLRRRGQRHPGCCGRRPP